MDTSDELCVDHETILRQAIYCCETMDQLITVASKLLYFFENKDMVELEDLLHDVAV